MSNTRIHNMEGDKINKHSHWILVIQLGITLQAIDKNKIFKIWIKMKSKSWSDCSTPLQIQRLKSSSSGPFRHLLLLHQTVHFFGLIRIILKLWTRSCRRGKAENFSVLLFDEIAFQMVSGFFVFFCVFSFLFVCFFNSWYLVCMVKAYHH